MHVHVHWCRTELTCTELMCSTGALHPRVENRVFFIFLLGCIVCVLARCRCYTNAQQLVLVLTITNVQSMPAVVSAGCNVLHYAVKEVYGDGKLVLPFPSSSSSRNAPCLSLCFDSAQSALLLWLMFAFINIKTQRQCCVGCCVGWKTCCIISLSTRLVRISHF